MNAAEPTIQQQVKEYEKSLRETVQKRAPSFSVPNRPANEGPNAWGQGNPWAAKKKQQQQPKVQVVMHPKGMALEELVQLLTLCGAGAEVLTKVQGHFSPPEPAVPLENRCAQLKTDIGREEPNLVGLRDRLRQREEDVAALRRNVDEKSELVSTLQQQLQEVKWEMANPPPSTSKPQSDAASRSPCWSPRSLKEVCWEMAMIRTCLEKLGELRRVKDPAPPTDPS